MAKLFYLMVGIPGSGKSYCISHNFYSPEFIVLSTDQLIEDYAKSINKNYDEVFEDYIGDATELFFHLLKDAIRKGQSIIVDRTNLTKKSRRRIMSLVPADYNKTAIVVTCDSETRNQRLISRKGKQIPADVIEKMIAWYDPPEYEEGFHSILNIDTTNLNEMEVENDK